MENARTRDRISKTVMYIILIIMAFIMLVPFAWMILTALKTNQEAIYRINCEAAEEIALQLRLRNLSGIIIIDFINMSSKEKQQELLENLRKLVRRDKQKTVVVDMTPLGLVEITRKKEYKPLWEQFKGV